MRSQVKWSPIGTAARLFQLYINGPKHPGKIRIIRSLGRTFFPKGVPLISETGSLFYADPAQFIGWQILSLGSYEPETINLGRDILSSGGVYADIGANVGLHLASWGSLPGVCAIAIEPIPLNFSKLKEVAIANSNDIGMLYNIAVSDRPQILIFEEIDIGNNGKARVSMDPDNVQKSSKLPVAAFPLEEIISHSKVEGICLLKIDVEGYELPVLRSLNWNGPFRPKNVIIEYSDYCSRVEGIGRRAIFDFFENAGYAAYEVDGSPMAINATPIEDNAWFVDRSQFSKQSDNE